MIFTLLDFAFEATIDTTDGRLATFFENAETILLDESLELSDSLACAGPDTNDATITNDSPIPKTLLFNTTSSNDELNKFGEYQQRVLNFVINHETLQYKKIAS